jgi:hypothetical protein
MDPQLTDLVADLKTLVARVSNQASGVAHITDQEFAFYTTANPTFHVSDSTGQTAIVPTLSAILAEIGAGPASIQKVHDASTAILVTARQIEFETALTAPRNFNLPPASHYAIGTAVVFTDMVGGIGATNTATLTAFGSDTIIGHSTLVLNAPYTSLMLFTDGVSAWTVLQSGTGGGGSLGAVLVAGTGIAVNNADPTHPVVALSTGTIASLAKADSALQSVVSGSGLAVDVTDPLNPVVALDATTIESLADADTAIQTVTAGSGISVDATDPLNVVVAFTGTGSTVDSVVAGTGIAVDVTDPHNPVVALNSTTIAALAEADTAIQTIVAGNFVAVDSTDPKNPIVSATCDFTGYYENNDLSDLLRGQPVYLDTSGKWKRATSIPPASNIVGILDGDDIPVGVSARAQTSGIISQPSAQWDEVTGMVGGLVPNAYYFLSSTGTLSYTPPTTVGQAVVRLGMALSSTEFLIGTFMQILL